MKLPSLTLAEEIVISPTQEIANIVKLKGSQNKERQTDLVGNIITYKKDNSVLFKELNEMDSQSPTFPRSEAIESTLSVVIVGAKLSHASLIPVAFKAKSIQVNSQKIIKWCEVKKKLDPMWANVNIDKSPGMYERLENIPKNLINSAEFIEDETLLQVDSLIDKLSQQQTNAETSFGEVKHKEVENRTNYKEDHSVFLTHAYPQTEGQNLAEKMLHKSKAISSLFN